jgi:hypothetical protein
MMQRRFLILRLIFSLVESYVNYSIELEKVKSLDSALPMLYF